MVFIRDQYQFSDRNRRESNQDRCFVINSSAATSDRRNIAIYAVCDGISNSNGGEAAEIAISALYRPLGGLVCELDMLAALPYWDGSGGESGATSQRDHIHGRMKDAIFAADGLLRERLNYGTTISIAVIFDECVYTANVGDSPIYLLRPGENALWEPKELYVCQNAAGELVRKGGMTKSEALASPQKNCLLRAAGVGPELQDEDIALSWSYLAQENILLAGSDGALSVFSEERLTELVRDCGSDGEVSVEALCRAIFEQVRNTEGADDNFTLIASAIRAG